MNNSEWQPQSSTKLAIFVEHPPAGAFIGRPIVNPRSSFLNIISKGYQSSTYSKSLSADQDSTCLNSPAPPWHDSVFGYLCEQVDNLVSYSATNNALGQATGTSQRLRASRCTGCIKGLPSNMVDGHAY